MLPPHPDAHQLHETKDDLSPAWRNWFVNIKDQTNLGENPSAIQDIVAADGVHIPVQVTNIIIRIQSSTAGVVDITSNPQIAAGFDGQVITLEGQSDTKGVKLDDGNGLALAGASSFTVGNNDVITLHFNKLKNLWIENNRSNN